MICSKCQLETPEADLKYGRCEACLREAVNLIDEASERPQRQQTGRILFGVQYSRDEIKGHVAGHINISSVYEVEKFIRDVVCEGGKVDRVTEVRMQFGEEYGEPDEVMSIAEWSRERIDTVAGKFPHAPHSPTPRTRIVTADQIERGWVKLNPDGTQTDHSYTIVGKVGENWEVVDPEPSTRETVKAEIKSRAHAAYRIGAADELVAKANKLRIKNLIVGREHVLAFLMRGTHPVMEGIPEDVEVLEVHEDWERRQFVFTIRHDSFPIRPPGQVPERIRPRWVLKEGT